MFKTVVARAGRGAIRTLLALSLAFFCLPLAADEGYSLHPSARAFIDAMVQEGFDRAYLNRLLADARRKDSILKAISKPAEKRLNWGEYRKIFLGKKRIAQGVAFWSQHQATLNRASEIYGVAPEIIVAIIGVETRYGRHAGSYRVLDALATLAFDYPPRSKFFTGQLKELLYLMKEEGLDPKELKGSYAGAMGYGQFIPSSYRSFAVDFDRDGVRDILKNPVDAIGSVAHYFKRHGWQAGESVTHPARLEKTVADSLFNGELKPELSLDQWRQQGVVSDARQDPARLATAMKLERKGQAEYWLGLHNFYVITRYNHSRLYAMAVYQLSQAILAARKEGAA